MLFYSSKKKALRFGSQRGVGPSSGPVEETSICVHTH